ncbi:MAG: GntR family transcriptional regulator [Burkholderiales bacterium]|nr:GntR family transcriptional regulator [Burkholderiales bacterium]
MKTLDEVLRIPNERLTLKQQAIDRLRQAILESRFAPGERLVERTLGDAMGVSRTAVREALCHLEAEGLVESGPRGPRVAQVTADDARAIYDAREVLEAAACRWFAERATKAQLTQLDEAADALDVAFATGDMHDILTCTRNFYHVLLEGAGNPVVESMLFGLQAKVSHLRALSMSGTARRPQSMQEIRSIVSALRKRDAERAATMSIRHVRSARDTALRHFSDRIQPPGGSK